MAGDLRLLPLACFLQRCAVVLCPDSGPRHLANAVGTPVVFVRNIAVGKVETGVYCETEIDVAPGLERVSLSKQQTAFAMLTPESVASRVALFLYRSAVLDLRLRCESIDSLFS